MTISTTTNSIQYTGNGVTTAFAVPFIFYDESDLIVTYTVIATGVDTVKTITTDYTVSGGNGSTGTVTALAAPASTIRITIERSIPYTQESDLLEGAAVLSATWEEVADRNTVLSQQLLASSNRTLKFPATLAGSYTGLLPAPEDGKILTWDGATGQIANADIADLSTSIDTVLVGLASGDFLTYDGTNWVNTAKGSLIVNGMQTDSSSGIVMENSGGTTVMTVGPTNTTNVAIAGGLTLGTALGPTHGGTGLSTYTTGDILYASAANTLAKLAKGTDGQFLKIGASIPEWASPPLSLFLHLQDQKAAGTNGGASTSGSWQTKTLNTEVTDTIGSTLSSNEFTLPAGTYEISASSPACLSNAHQARLYNVTDAAVALYGTSEFSSSGSQTITQSLISGRITIADTKTFRIEHRVAVSRATDGYGAANNFGGTEIYTDVKVYKI